MPKLPFWHINDRYYTKNSEKTDCGKLYGFRLFLDKTDCVEFDKILYAFGEHKIWRYICQYNSIKVIHDYCNKSMKREVKNMR